mgnify:CR=1 FL=1
MRYIYLFICTYFERDPMLDQLVADAQNKKKTKTTTRVDMINNISSAEREIENSTTRTVCGCKIVVQVYKGPRVYFFEFGGQLNLLKSVNFGTI